MKKRLFNTLLQSVTEAAAIERGESKPSRAFEVKSSDTAPKDSARIASESKASAILVNGRAWV
jgi:hypothetical protein